MVNCYKGQTAFKQRDMMGVKKRLLWWMLTLQMVLYSSMELRLRKSIMKENHQTKSNWFDQCEIPSFVSGDYLIFF